jgi:pimeloyl-ACP methyl ester carboxylesterase
MSIWRENGQLPVRCRAVAASCHLILHDRRGTGLSSRNVAAPNLETRMSDLRLVLHEVGSECPVLGGINEAGAPVPRPREADQPQPRTASAMLGT